MVPPFSMTHPMYDMSTWWGRTKYWANAVNPMLLLENDRTLQKSQMLLDEWKDRRAGPGVSNKELWHARTSVENCIHPTSGDTILPFFRMAAFLPANYLIVPIMMAPSTVASMSRSLTIQVLNQSYGSAVNYANRSSDRQPVSEIVKAYLAAVVVACSGSMVATRLLQKVPTGTPVAMLIRATGPFAAVCLAAVVNLACMRKNEWLPGGQGIKVVDEDGVVRGQSVVAGQDSLWKCSFTRILWNVPCMMLPTLMMMPLSRYVGVARRHPLVSETVLQLVGVTMGVPPALAAYNVNQHIDVSRLEDRFHNLKRLDGTSVKTLTYYKGL